MSTSKSVVLFLSFVCASIASADDRELEQFSTNIFDCEEKRDESTEETEANPIGSLVFMATYKDMLAFNTTANSITVPMDVLIVLPKKNYKIPLITKMPEPFSVTRSKKSALLKGAFHADGASTRISAKLPLELMAMNTVSYEADIKIVSEELDAQGKVMKKVIKDGVCRRDGSN